jgi:predicted lactoylglutathione lyase
MIGYVTLGTNDFEKAAKFYDALFAEMGAKRLMDFGTFVMWGTTLAVPGVALTKPYDKKPATVGNGCMTALACKSKADVDKFYNKVLELGGTDEGKPGPRGDTFYGAYWRDLDGNKLNFFYMGK